MFSFYPTNACGTTSSFHSQCGCHSYHAPTHTNTTTTTTTSTTPIHLIEETSNGGAYYKTKLEEFAAVCSTSCKLALPVTVVADQQQQQQPPKSTNERMGHVNNIILSNVPHELYRAIKQMVSAYESMCQNMMELVK